MKDGSKHFLNRDGVSGRNFEIPRHSSRRRSERTLAAARDGNAHDELEASVDDTHLMTHIPTLFHRQDQCIECNVAFAPSAERFLINDRHWCTSCAAPYRTSFAGSMLRDMGMFAVASVAGLGAFIVLAITPFARLSIWAGAAAFVGILLTWFMRPKVYVERVGSGGSRVSRGATR